METNIQLRLQLNRKGTVDDEYAYNIQNDSIVNISLKKHQLQTIQAMSTLESNRKRITEHDYLVSEIGILSNKVGSGKSLCVLGLIASQPRLTVQDFVNFHVGNSIFVMNDRSFMDIRGGNMIVVPNHLVAVWEEYLGMYTTFKYITIKKRMFPISDWEEIATCDVVICCARYYNMFNKACPWTWSRVIFDEADSINIPACVKPNARFVWFVSSSLKNLMFCNGFYLKCDTNGILTRVVTRGITRQGYIKSTFKELDDPIANPVLHGIVVKMNDAYVDRHITLPPVYDHVIRCKDPIFLCVLRDVVSDQVASLLQGCDTAGALDYLGCPVDTKENIISFVCRSFHVQKRNYNLKLDYLNNIEIVDNDSSESLREKIQKTNEKIRDIDCKLKNIHQKVDQLALTDQLDVYCPICMEGNVGELCMYMCCLNVFCKKCVHIMLSERKHSNTCPLCRGDLKQNDIILQSIATHNGVHELSDNKFTKVIELIKDIYSNPEKRVLVFVWYDNTLDHLSHMLGTMHFHNFRNLAGNTHSIKRTVDWFNSGRIRVLLVNASVYGCGLNLVGATDIIFFQKMNGELEKQLTGRAHRIGRTHELHIHRVMHQTE